MNHTERIAEVASRHRQITRRLAKEAIETYLELLAEEIAQGEWVDIHGIGKITVDVEESSGTLVSPDGKRHQTSQRLRTKIRLFQRFKEICYARFQ
ncbi:MAG TPA: HU family DNA-binding protein [Aggregatilineales bacterium]|nr:HU family DNA-binding protein [Aggregatilineales bacterium]